MNWLYTMPSTVRNGMMPQTLAEHEPLAQSQQTIIVTSGADGNTAAEQSLDATTGKMVPA
jgi:hypothetical protein